MSAPQTRTFADLGVSAPVVAALAERDVEHAFPIQEAVIEAALDGRDICGKAPTGSGKTLAFGVPTVDLAPAGGPWNPTALILSPTRELASQIKQELEPLAKARSRKIEAVFGGTNIERDIKRLEAGIDILVACPGRLEDLISRRCVELRDAGIVVVDEADRMADMGFLPSVKRILDQTPDNRHTLLFSATLDGDVDALIGRYQNDPLTFEVDEGVEEQGEVEHSWHLVEPMARIDIAADILRRYWSSIVFCRTRRGCDRVTKLLVKRGLTAVAIHGDRSQAQRERALRDFTSGKAQVLVATDVAARGIHVDNVELVLHYDPANEAKDHVHRSGRTGRAGQDGRVISLIGEDKEKMARKLQKELGVARGFDPLDLDALPDPATQPPRPVVDDEVEPRQSSKASRKPRDQKPRSKQGGEKQAGGRRGGRKQSGEKQAGGRRGGQRQASQQRGGGRGDGRGNRRGGTGQGRRDEERDRRPTQGKKQRGAGSGQGRNNRGDSSQREGNRRDARTGQGRNNRGDSSQRESNRRDARQGRNNRGDSSQREGKHGRGTQGPNRRRRGRNDWYPPDWDDERETPPGGSNTTKRKSRSQKGRHADRDTGRNKGRRRRPR